MTFFGSEDPHKPLVDCWWRLYYGLRYGTVQRLRLQAGRLITMGVPGDHYPSQPGG